jgi:uncharacterized membrane protein
VSRDTGALVAFAIVAVASVTGIGIAAASLATRNTMAGMMGGMMGGGTGPAAEPGGLEWVVLLVSVGFFLSAVVLLVRGRSIGPPAPPASVSQPSVRPPEAVAPEAKPLPELTLVKLLDEDERRMYLEIRDHGGSILQRDLVELRTFSKAKVTRLLNKLERRGLVVRERHGMTNRVRIVAKAAR